MINYLKLMRIKHYIKNGLIFLPLLFSGNLFNSSMFGLTCIAFVSFSLLASAIYVFNDIFDYEKDKLHPKKKFRPIASGKISKQNAIVFFFILLLISYSIPTILLYSQVITTSVYAKSIIIMLGYLLINILYTVKIKHIPIFDILFLAFGFILRVYFGGVFSNIEISSWLSLTILSFSLYLVLGKRKGELEKNKNSRPVLKYYTVEFLEKFMYSFLTLTLVFYSLWCINASNASGGGVSSLSNYLIYSIFIIIFIIMRYSLNIENKDNEYLSDPVEVLVHDKALLISVLIYFVYMGGILYGKYLGL